jgi:hypothetical protein
MQASTQKKEYVTIPADGKTEKIMKMSAQGRAIKVGMIAGGAIAAGIVIAYYLRKRSSLSR